MIPFIGARIGQGALALLALSAIVFALSRTTGDVSALILPIGATQEDYVRLGQELGLDKPLPVQYGLFLVNALKGDLGISLYSRERVTTLLWERTQRSVYLGLIAGAMVLVIGISSGVLAAANRGTPADSAVTFLAVLGISVPAFWAGIVLIQVFAVWLRWLPAGTDQGPRAVILPAFTLALTGIGGVARLLRSAMLETLDSDYIILARAKGVSETGILLKHALKNAIGPVLAYAGVLFVIMLTLSMTVEVVFAWPGIGQLTYSAVLSRDFPVVQGVVLLAGSAAIVIGFLADVLHAYVDPRIRNEPG